MATVLDALAIDIWRLYRDGILKGGCVGTYEGAGLTIKIRRIDDGLLHLDLGDKGEILVAIKYSLLRAHLSLLHCPNCDKTSSVLYLYEGELRCRKCHGLALDPIAKIIALGQRIENAKGAIALYEERKAAGKKNAYRINAGRYRVVSTARKALPVLERELAEERLKLWRSCEASEGPIT